MAEIINLADQRYRRGHTLEEMLTNYSDLVANRALRIEPGERAFLGVMQEINTPQAAVMARLCEAQDIFEPITEVDI